MIEKAFKHHKKDRMKIIAEASTYDYNPENLDIPFFTVMKLPYTTPDWEYKRTHLNMRWYRLKDDPRIMGIYFEPQGFPDFDTIVMVRLS